MADSLVLTGVKDVRKHTGTEMLRLNPKGGGDTFSLKRWWVGAGVSTCYEPCTVIRVSTGSGTVKLAIATKAEGARVRVDHDGSFNFTFIGAGEISRAALFTDSFELIEHYVFPSISGGKVMTVTPSGSANRPTGDSELSFTSDGNITGTLEVGETITIFSAGFTGGIGNVTTANILQASDTGAAPWNFVAQSANNSFTHVIGAGLDGKFLRESTQLTDDDGLVSRNGDAKGPVTTP
jgi:hypothetical protein